ncbi:cytochrome P450 [Phytohabitans suffuscus]
MSNDNDSAPAGAEADWASFNHLQVAAMADPGPLIHDLRGVCPVGHSEQHGGFWVLTDYADVRQAARTPESFPSSTRLGPGAGFPYSAKFPIPSPMINDDLGRHRDFRMPLQKKFSPAMAESLEPAIRTIVTDLIDGFIERGSADLASELCVPLPALVTGELLDLPLYGRRELREWAQSIVADGPQTNAYTQLRAFVEELYDIRSADPGEDLPSYLLTLEIEGRAITRTEWVGLVVMLILAGLDTTSNGGALILHYLAEHPQVRGQLAANPESIRGGIEELLRLASPVPQHSRGVAEDCVVGGQQLKKGDVVLLHWMSANRDPAQFPDPDEYVADRSPNPHFAFGFGPHRCLGSFVAKVELRTMVEQVLRRLPDYEVVPDEVVRYTGLNRGMSNLGVRFTPGPRVAKER